MPHLIGIELHTDGISVAALRPDQTLVVRPVDDLARILQRTAPLRWKWSLGSETRDADAVAVTTEIFLALQHALGDDSALAAVAIPAVWSERARRSLLRAMEETSIQVMRLVRDTTALAIGATLLDPARQGMCAILDVGVHKLEVAVADVATGSVKVRARRGMVGLDGSNVKPEGVLPLVTEVARYVAREAGVAPESLRHVFATGRRLAHHDLAQGLAGIWGRPVEALPPGAAALGAAALAVSLTGMTVPWTLHDDLDEPPLAALRGTARSRSTLTPAPAPPPPPEREVLPLSPNAVPVETYRTPAAARPSSPAMPRVPTPAPPAPTPAAAPAPTPAAAAPVPAAPEPPARPSSSTIPRAPVPRAAPPRAPSSGSLPSVTPPSPPAMLHSVETIPPLDAIPQAEAVLATPSRAEEIADVEPEHGAPLRSPGSSQDLIAVDTGRISEHPSMAPPSAHVLEVLQTGPFVGLPTLDSVRALHLVRPAEAEGLVRAPLVTLLNQFTFLRGTSGTLTLRSHGDEVHLPIDRGGVCLNTAERPRTLRVFEWADGTFSWRKEKHPWTTQKHRMPMTAYLVSGLRVRLRAFDDAAFTQVHLPKMRLSPSLVDERRGRLERLGLPEAEHRAADTVIDGTRSFETMLGEGYIGRTTLQRLVLLLDLYGILHWAQPTHADHEDPAQAMAKLFAKIDKSNHFVALGVHWSAPPMEILAAWEKIQELYGPGGRLERYDPTTAARIVRRCAGAWNILRIDALRVAHRREAYPGMDEDLLAPLVEGRAKALEMRGEAKEAAVMMKLRGEFHVSVAPPADEPKTKR